MMRVLDPIRERRRHAADRIDPGPNALVASFGCLFIVGDLRNRIVALAVYTDGKFLVR